MKAIRLFEPGSRLRMTRIDPPVPGPSDLLVRVKAAGICHSDAHYRNGTSPVENLPITLGHEVAGIVERAGSQVSDHAEGTRVCVHYMATCGECGHCRAGNDQFCSTGRMIGKHRDGGYAEYVLIPARSAFTLPDEISFEEGAVLMCSSATSFHALKKARLRPGESAAVFGIGGLGVSAVQLARAFGASEVYAVDLRSQKLDLARRHGAIPIDAGAGDPVRQILNLTGGRGVDVALELIGLPSTMRSAVRSLAILGRAVIVGITDQSFDLAPYHELINKEAEVIGVSDHLALEIPELIRSLKRGDLSLSNVITSRIPLEETAVNDTLDELERFSETIRCVITP